MSHHHHSQHHCCECCGKECGCCRDMCHVPHHHEEGQGDFSKELLEMADQAWMEVLKEKIKAQIIASSGNQLDQLAKMVSEANNERWKHKLSQRKGVVDFRDEMHAFFSRE